MRLSEYFVRYIPAQGMTDRRDMDTVDGVSISNLTFQYSIGPTEKGPTVLENVSVSIPRGSTCLVIGGNGAGKSTLLRLIGGVHMCSPMDAVKVLDRNAFGDRVLNSHRVLLKSDWATQSVAFAGYKVPLSGSFPVRDMNRDWQEQYPERAKTLQHVLGVDLDWHMNQVSDGQRRRIQLYLNLLRPFQVLLMDEVLSVLDVLCRKRILHFLKQECEQRQATVLYATHIFDGLYDWTSHLVYLKKGGVLGYAGEFTPISIPDLATILKEGQHSPVLHLVETWLLREQRDEKEPELGHVAEMTRNQLLDPQYGGGGFVSGRIKDI